MHAHTNTLLHEGTVHVHEHEMINVGSHPDRLLFNTADWSSCNAHVQKHSCNHVVECSMSQPKSTILL